MAGNNRITAQKTIAPIKVSARGRGLDYIGTREQLIAAGIAKPGDFPVGNSKSGKMGTFLAGTLFMVDRAPRQRFTARVNYTEAQREVWEWLTEPRWRHAPLPRVECGHRLRNLA
jgi:hypothetical protein